MSQQTEQQKQWGKIVAKAWADEDYKSRLLANPHQVLLDEGVEAPQNMAIRVVEAHENELVLVLPAKPASSAAIDEAEVRRSAFIYK